MSPHDKMAKLAWQGRYWGPNEALELAAKQYQQQIQDRAALMTLANTYYSASGNAVAQLRTATGLNKLRWAWRAFWCLWQARRLSDKRAHDGGVESMSVDELDIYSRILFRQKKFYEAFGAIIEGLRKTDVQNDSIIMLHMTLAQLHLKEFQKTQNQKMLDYANFWCKSVEEKMSNLKTSTQVRAHHALALFNLQRGDHAEAARHATLARQIAAENGFADQLLKLEHLP